MKFNRNSIWLIPLFFIATFPLWSIPVGKFLTPRGGFDPELKKPNSQTQNFNMDTVKILQNQKGKKTAFIRAARAHTDKNPDILIMEIVDADLFDEEGYITNILARKGKYNTLTNILTLIDDVVVHKIRDKQYLYTDLLLYDSEKRTVKCPGKTRLEGEKVEIDGGSLDYDIKSQSYVIGNRVHCIIGGFIEP